MAASAEYIVKARQQMIQELSVPNLAEEKQELQFEISANPKTYLQQLMRNRMKEMDLGFTLNGPHRDDLSIFIEGKLARLFASEGQKKTAIAALKLAEWERLSKKAGAAALMCFDDLGAALDEKRQNEIQKRFFSLGQVFVTTPYLPKTEGYHIEIQSKNFK